MRNSIRQFTERSPIALRLPKKHKPDISISLNPWEKMPNDHP